MLVRILGSMESFETGFRLLVSILMTGNLNLVAPGEFSSELEHLITACENEPIVEAHFTNLGEHIYEANKIPFLTNRRTPRALLVIFANACHLHPDVTQFTLRQISADLGVKFCNNLNNERPQHYNDITFGMY